MILVGEFIDWENTGNPNTVFLASDEIYSLF